MKLFVSDLENVELLVTRHTDQLKEEDFLTEEEIESVVQNEFLNSKISDIDYLLDDLKVSIVDGEVVDDRSKGLTKEKSEGLLDKMDRIEGTLSKSNEKSGKEDIDLDR